MANVSSPAVLLVDPYDDSREMYAQYLSSCGFIPTTSESGDEALDKVSNADVIVTGIQIRGSFDGIELLRRVRSQDLGKPVIVLTAVADNSSRQKAYDAGCDAFLAKPCYLDVLAAEIRRLLAMSRDLRERSRALQARADDQVNRSNGLLKTSGELRNKSGRDPGSE